MTSRNLSAVRLLAARFLFLVVFFGGVKCSEEGDAGVKVVLTRQGLEYAAFQAVEILSKKIPETNIDNVEGRADVTIGNVDYEIKNARITSFTKPSSRVSVNNGHGLTMSLIDAGVSVSGDWRYKFKKGFLRFSDSGSFSASTSGVSISVDVRLWKNENGSPSMSATDCRCSINDVNFRLRGGASWLYNLFLRFYKDKIKSSLERVLCKEAKDALNRNGVEELATLNLQANINDLLVIDYRLVSNPVFENDFMVTSHVGRFLYDEGREEAPPMTTATDRMVSVSISDVAFNSVSRVLFKNNKFRFESSFTTDAFVDSVLIVLNGTELPFQASGLSLSLGATHAPRVTFNPGSLKLEGEADGRIDILNEEGSRANAITLKMEFACEMNAWIEGNKLVGSIINVVPKLTYCSLSIVDLDTLNEVIASIANILSPSFDEALARGLPLPNVEGVHFQDSVIQLHSRHMTIATNAEYRR